MRNAEEGGGGGGGGRCIRRSKLLRRVERRVVMLLTVVAAESAAGTESNLLESSSPPQEKGTDRTHAHIHTSSSSSSSRQDERRKINKFVWRERNANARLLFSHWKRWLWITSTKIHRRHRREDGRDPRATARGRYFLLTADGSSVTHVCAYTTRHHH